MIAFPQSILLNYPVRRDRPLNTLSKVTRIALSKIMFFLLADHIVHFYVALIIVNQILLVS